MISQFANTCQCCAPENVLGEAKYEFCCMWVFYSLSIDRLTLYGFLVVGAALVVTWSTEGENATVGNCIMSLMRAVGEPEGHQSISPRICALSI